MASNYSAADWVASMNFVALTSAPALVYVMENAPPSLAPGPGPSAQFLLQGGFDAVNSTGNQSRPFLRSGFSLVPSFLRGLVVFPVDRSLNLA